MSASVLSDTDVVSRGVDNLDFSLSLIEKAIRGGEPYIAGFVYRIEHR